MNKTSPGKLRRELNETLFCINKLWTTELEPEPTSKLAGAGAGAGPKWNGIPTLVGGNEDEAPTSPDNESL